MLMLFILSLGLSITLIFINSSISTKKIQEREKPSSFECGFDPKTMSRVPFSLRFYLIAIIFLIFDVEITLIIPIPLITSCSNFLSLTYAFLFFLALLVAGLYHEWNQGALEWK